VTAEEEDGGTSPAVRPPILYPLAILIGYVLQLLWPVGLVPRGVQPLGAVLIFAAVALFVLSVREFRRAGTPVPSHNPVVALVRSGPYRFSRNPIYVAFTLLQIGFAVWLDSAWILAMLVPVLPVMSYGVIAREERYLEARFGEEYRSYARSVRRWL
jgi:protein-S-isoprenylcysteine O-methyltransferase Ste14